MKDFALQRVLLFDNTDDSYLGYYQCVVKVIYQQHEQYALA